MAKVIKVSIELTVLCEADQCDDISQMDLADIVREMDEGTFIGVYKIASMTPLANAEVEPELLAIGNDGTFFDLTDEDDGKPDAAA